jgi:hypothetical protein
MGGKSLRASIPRLLGSPRGKFHRGGKSHFRPFLVRRGKFHNCGKTYGRTIPGLLGAHRGSWPVRFAGNSAFTTVVVNCRKRPKRNRCLLPERLELALGKIRGQFRIHNGRCKLQKASDYAEARRRADRTDAPL